MMRYEPLFGGAALVLATVLLSARGTRTGLIALALQSWAVALTMAWTGSLRGDGRPAAAALIVIAAQGLAIPFALGRASRPREGQEAAGPGVFAALLLGLAAVVLALLVVRPSTGAGSVAAHEHLAMALATVLLGLVGLITHRDRLAQAISFTALLNGALLALAVLPGTPLLVPLVLGTSALAATVTLGAAGPAERRTRA